MSVMRHRWMTSVIPLLALLGSGTVAGAQDGGEANRLLVEAVQLWQEAGSLEGTGAEIALARLDLLDDVAGHLDVIVSEHAESDLALRLVLGEPVGPFTLEDVREAVEEARAEPDLPLIDCREDPSSACIGQAISDGEAAGLRESQYAEFIGAYAVESGDYDLLAGLPEASQVAAAHDRLAAIGRLTTEAFDAAALAMQRFDRDAYTATDMLTLAKEALDAGVGGPAGAAQARRLADSAAVILEEELNSLQGPDLNEVREIRLRYVGLAFVDLSRVRRILGEPEAADASLAQAAEIGARLSELGDRGLVFRLVIEELFARGEIDEAVALIERPDTGQHVEMHIDDLVEAGRLRTIPVLLAVRDQEDEYTHGLMLGAIAKVEGAEAAFAQMRRFEDAQNPSSLLVAIADGALAGGDREGAKDATYRALAIPDLNLGDFNQAAEALGRVAVDFLEAGDVSAARASLERLLALEGPEPDDLRMELGLIRIALEAEARAGDPERARALARELVARLGHSGGDVDRGRDEVWRLVGKAAMAGDRVGLGIEAAGRIRDMEARNQLLLDALYTIMEQS